MATPDGVKPYHKAKAGDTVLCYNPENAEYSYQPILEIVEYEYSDTAYRLIGDFGEQVVSRNHRCIVERDGKEVFVFAEDAAREQQARIPVLESLRELQDALSDAEQGASEAQQDVQPGLREGANRQGQYRGEAAGPAQGQNGSLRGLRNSDMEAGRMAPESESANVQPGMQRQTARPGLANHAHKGRANWTPESESALRDRMTGETNPAWKGGLTYRNRKGAYASQPIKYVRCPLEMASMARKDGYVMEHRLTVAAAIGRPLTQAECVHHINHDATDNRLENLMLFATNADHKKFEHGAAIEPLWCGLNHSTTEAKCGACECQQVPSSRCVTAKPFRLVTAAFQKART
jgi:hypothetical protein